MTETKKGHAIEVMLFDGTPPDALGLLPHMLDPADKRTAREQFDAKYPHGGGWRPMSGFKLEKQGILRYPGDPPFKPIAMMRHHNEVVLFYPCAIVMILQSDGKFEVARMD